MRGISGTNIEKGYNRVVVHDDEKLVEHCVYTLANPCSANLVARSRHWKGASSLGLEYGVPVSVERPKFGVWAGKLTHTQRRASQRSKRAQYAGRCKLPERVDLVLSRPPVMTHLDDAELRAHIRRQLDETELELIRERKQKNRRVLGWKNVVAQHFLDIPRPEERFGLTPSFSGKSLWARVEAAQRRSTFIADYYAALEAFAAGAFQTAFPVGTWLMKRRFGVTCCPVPSG
jgi:putative transposase